MRRCRKELLVGLALVAGTLAAFWPVVYCGFVNFDDGAYVTENPRVFNGLTRQNVRWALTATYAANWHPLTWMSLQLDATLFGLNPRAFHLTNLALHLGSTLLLFAVLRFMTGAIWRSALLAALFALHPLHVESVAWVAERKDDLSTLFWMLTLLAYAWYSERPGVLRYLLVVVSFALGLAAKPMLVTLPCVLLLLDYWPLRRLRLPGAEDQPTPHAVGLRRLVLEKLPLFVLSAAACFVTLQAQRGAVSSLDQLPLRDRLLNVVASYGGYLDKTIWPSGLCVLYPHPFDSLPLWQPILSGLALILFSALAYWQRRSHPYVAVGWLWYLGTLVPVIGLVQVGEQAMADRYTYVPLIGVFLALAWGLPAFLSAYRVGPAAMVFPALLLLVACGVATRAQVWRWRNSVELWEHTLKVTTNNATAQNNLGGALMEEGRNDEAAEHLLLALRLRRGVYPKASHNLGLISARQGDLSAAAAYYLRAIENQPDHAVSLNNLGLVQSWQGRPDKALQSFRSAVQLQPGSARYRFHLACALQMEGDVQAARLEYDEGMRLDPTWPSAIDRSAWQMATREPMDKVRMQEALTQAMEACQATENRRPEFLDTLAVVYAANKRYEEAVETARLAVELATASAQPELAQRIEGRLRLYEQRKPFREGN